MRKSTFYGLATLCAVGSLLFGFEFFVGGRSSSQPPEARVEQDFLAIGNAIKSYQINAGGPPSTAQGLDALVDKPTRGPKPRRWVQVMKKLPVDPWLNPYRYSLSAAAGEGLRWEIRCAGRDGFFGSSDDIVHKDESSGAFFSPAFQAEVRAEPRPSY